jgi:adenylosuccinate synthase
MRHEAVIGLGFGDEGKGLVTDFYASENPDSTVIRYSGGQQAGHQVALSDGSNHVFSNFGSGTLRGSKTYWYKTCTIDPVGIMNELDVLLSKGYKPELIIDPRCPITTPFEIQKNINDETINKHGSCGLGINATWQREEKFYSLLAGDLLNGVIFEIKLEQLKKYYHDVFQQYYYIFKMDIINFLTACAELQQSQYVKIINYTDDFNTTKKVIFEGSQGILLDQKHGFFPNVTRSSTGVDNIIEITTDVRFNFVTRAYQTRHGNGPMTNEGIPHNIKINPNETNKLHVHQGVFRRSTLDLNLLKYALDRQAPYSCQKDTRLFITCLDHIENEWKLTIEGELIEYKNEADFIWAIGAYLNMKNILISRTPVSDNIEEF